MKATLVREFGGPGVVELEEVARRFLRQGWSRFGSTSMEGEPPFGCTQGQTRRSLIAS